MMVSSIRHYAVTGCVFTVWQDVGMNRKHTWMAQYLLLEMIHVNAVCAWCVSISLLQSCGLSQLYRLYVYRMAMWLVKLVSVLCCHVKDLLSIPITAVLSVHQVLVWLTFLAPFVVWFLVFAVCQYEGDEYEEDSRWTSKTNPCVQCRCRVVCSKPYWMNTLTLMSAVLTEWESSLQDYPLWYTSL